MVFVKCIIHKLPKHFVSIKIKDIITSIVMLKKGRSKMEKLLITIV